jgi:hypothetical protein
MMDIFSYDDVDKFFDKFEDPSYEVERIAKAVIWLEHMYVRHKTTEDQRDVRNYFLKKLIMKSYRLGKEHAYMDTVNTIRTGGFIKREGP